MFTHRGGSAVADRAGPYPLLPVRDGEFLFHYGKAKFASTRSSLRCYRYRTRRLSAPRFTTNPAKKRYNRPRTRPGFTPSKQNPTLNSDRTLGAHKRCKRK